ncbi:carboxypeptidase-like regulatory domain-containing protein [Hymenobacter sp. CRA2]|uniref:carboxypeptidase-like regulatory domain-containing protein n=1 Tax=Hymenobacter sp. CRA2 TaxID=1955620 RepID=UPI00098F34B4|nr:carboxypeptidase-like regulatory domain-containing protein [Hymenobacter sp. CRA2]OON68220.1 hypothetical protein B0919_13765 [Hymenobacter sp. CRA2]
MLQTVSLLSLAGLLCYAGTAQAQHSTSGSSPVPGQSAPSSAAASSAPTSYVLQGQVLTEDSRPLPGATIRVASNKQVYITNSEGYFSFTSPQPAEEVQVSLAGYDETKAQLRRGPVTPISLKLLPGTRFKADGRIKKTDSTGKIR